MLSVPSCAFRLTSRHFLERLMKTFMRYLNYLNHYLDITHTLFNFVILPDSPQKL